MIAYDIDLIALALSGRPMITENAVFLSVRSNATDLAISIGRVLASPGFPVERALDALPFETLYRYCRRVADGH